MAHWKSVLSARLCLFTHPFSRDSYRPCFVLWATFRSITGQGVVKFARNCMRYHKGEICRVEISSRRTVCQPNVSMRAGATSRPNNEPTWRPPNMYDVARERSRVSISRAIISVDALGATPSPKPTAARHRNSPAGGARAQTIYAVPRRFN